jgi:predicted SAM-dependent methyltransferase
MSESSGFGYPNFRTLALCVPWSGRPLPPELPMAFKNCSPPMNSNTIYFETRGKNIDEARNWFAEQAIKNNAKYLFFWDEDVLVPPHALRELMYVADNWKDIAVIGGIYCLKVERPEPLVFKTTGGGPYWDWKVGEVFPCAATGMGCTLIRAEVFKDIERPWFRTVDDLSPYLDNIPSGEQWTEDLYFCRKVADTKKWKIMAHGGLLMPHIDVRTGKRYELPPDSKPARRLAMPVGTKKILDIAPGESGPMKTNEGKVVTVDIRDGLGVDYRCDFRKMPFATGEFAIVHCSQGLEHIRRTDVSPTLDEWIRVLSPDGELRITVPNLEWAAKRILAGDVGDMIPKPEVTALDVLYAQQQYDEDFHMNGWTVKTLERELRKKGFKYFSHTTPSFLIAMRAWRKNPPKEILKAKSNGKHA